MADLNNILIFVKVAQFESVTRAARSLGMPISTVGRRLSVLESELGAGLVKRTTRRVDHTLRVMLGLGEPDAGFLEAGPKSGEAGLGFVEMLPRCHPALRVALSRRCININ